MKVSKIISKDSAKKSLSPTHILSQLANAPNAKQNKNKGIPKPSAQATPSPNNNSPANNLFNSLNQSSRKLRDFNGSLRIIKIKDTDLKNKIKLKKMKLPKKKISPGKDTGDLKNDFIVNQKK